MRDIDPILELLASHREKYLATVATVPEDRWLERPRQDRWSAAEITAHLTQVEHGVQKTVQRVLSSTPAKVPFSKRFHLPVWFASVRLRKVKSPAALKAERIAEKPKMLEAFAMARKISTDFLEANRGRDLSPYSATHPLLGVLDLYQWHEFLAYHEDRHRKQLREIVDSFHL